MATRQSLYTKIRKLVTEEADYREKSLPYSTRLEVEIDVLDRIREQVDDWLKLDALKVENERKARESAQ